MARNDDYTWSDLGKSFSDAEFSWEDFNPLRGENWLRGPNAVRNTAQGIGQNVFGDSWFSDLIKRRERRLEGDAGLPKMADLRDGWNTGPDSGKQKMAAIMAAARDQGGRDRGAPAFQPNDPRLGRNIEGPWSSGRFTPGGGSTRGVGPDWQDVPPTADELYEELFDLRRAGAQGTFDAISDWATDKQRSGAANIGRMRGRLGAQWDVDDERRGKDVARIGMAEAGNYKGRKAQVTADADASRGRLVELGIDPDTFIDSPQDEYGARLANSFAGGATFSATVEMMGNRAAADRRSRAEQGFSQAESDLASGVSDALFMAQMNLDNSMATINEAVLMRQIDKVEAADLVDQKATDAFNIATFVEANPGAVAAFMDAGALPDMLDYIIALTNGQDEGMSESPFTGDMLPDDDIQSKLDIQKALLDLQTQHGDEYMSQQFPYYMGQQTIAQ